jgi:D-alanyl-D-alanine carboxypeptidase
MHYAPPPPVFAATVARVTAAELRYSYRSGCPVTPPQLRRVQLRTWGFDGRPHTGALVVNRTVVTDIVTVFRRLYEARFPIRRMRPIDAYRGSDSASTADDNTAAFNCRYAVSPGPKHWSAHAYGLAIDVDPVENPYVLGGVALPRAGAAFADRSRVRPGMALPGGILVESFRSVGWKWGGRWTGSPDYQHFSSTGG